MHAVIRQGRAWWLLALVGIVAGASVLSAGGVAQSRATATPMASPGASPMASPIASPSAAEDFTIDIAMIAFQTPLLEVPVGSTVTWTNSDVVAHTVTHQPDTGGLLFDSGYFQPGESWSYTFDEEGTFDYYCIPHPNMIGTIVVTSP